MREMPFPGTPPAVRAGDAVEIRDGAGQWWPATALSGPRYDQSRGSGRTVWLTVLVRTEDGFEENWAADGVRPAATETEGP